MSAIAAPSMTLPAPVKKPAYSRAPRSCAGASAVAAAKMTSLFGEPSSHLPAVPALQRVFFSPHPDDVAYSAYGTASVRPRCCSHDDYDNEVIDLKQEQQNHKHAALAAVAMAATSSSPLPSPSLSARSSSSFGDDTTLFAESSSSFSSSSSSTSSRRNSATTPSSPATAYSSEDEDDIHATSSGKLNNDALIVTVFSQSRCANGAIGARLQRNVEATTTLRTDEDEAFARSIGCDLLQLGFPDSSARDEPSRRPDLAEAACAQQKAGLSITDVDHAIYADVRRALAPLVWMAIRAGAQIHIPLGVGCHVDHWMVRVAVLSLIDELSAKLAIATAALPCKSGLRNAFITLLAGGSKPIHERLIFYEDLPYADAQTNAHIESLARSVLPVGTRAKLVHLTEQAWCRKRAAVLAYASQMKPTILPSLYNHATRLAQLGQQIDPDWQADDKSHLAAERIWIVDGALRRQLLLEEAASRQA